MTRLLIVVALSAFTLGLAVPTAAAALSPHQVDQYALHYQLQLAEDNTDHWYTAVYSPAVYELQRDKSALAAAKAELNNWEGDHTFDAQIAGIDAAIDRAIADLGDAHDQLQGPANNTQKAMIFALERRCGCKP